MVAGRRAGRPLSRRRPRLRCRLLRCRRQAGRPSLPGHLLACCQRGRCRRCRRRRSSAAGESAALTAAPRRHVGAAPRGHQNPAPPSAPAALQREGVRRLTAWAAGLGRAACRVPRRTRAAGGTMLRMPADAGGQAPHRPPAGPPGEAAAGWLPPSGSFSCTAMRNISPRGDSRRGSAGSRRSSTARPRSPPAHAAARPPRATSSAGVGT